MAFIITRGKVRFTH